jgi:hypothetical protein
MAIVSLLVLPSPSDEHAYKAFQFEHLMTHRAVLPKTPQATLSLLLDPMQYEWLPGSKWHLDHQQDHNVSRGKVNSDQILRDSNLFNEEQRLWWTFINHQEHTLLMAARP